MRRDVVPPVAPPTGRVHEVEVDEVVDAELLQLEDDGAEVGAEYLRVGLLLHLLPERLLGVEPEALAGLRAAGAARPLLRARLADRRHEQRLDTDPRVVHLAARARTTAQRVALFLSFPPFFSFFFVLFCTMISI